MADLGRMNRLVVSKKVDFGVYLNSDKYGEILLPRKYVPDNCQIGDTVTVFVHKDSEDRIIATNIQPKGLVGDFACLVVTDVNEFGAFLDWGLEKDLFVPFKEQKKRMLKGHKYTVFIYVDKLTDRILASSKTGKFLEEPRGKIKEGDEVSILVADEIEIGFPTIIENYYSGMLYKNEIFEEIKVGDRLKAFVKKIRHDGLIDLALQKSGHSRSEPLADDILNKLRMQGGFMPLNSKSSPEQIQKLFGCSKKTFKMAIGGLYKKRLIVITDEGIKLTAQNGSK